ncbi:MAG TPA: hypothetical protein VMZ53_01705 [Kofleriaceae bacterium]|nr:hypothetical protein [Kofleriaceae bacterium]
MKNLKLGVLVCGVVGLVAVFLPQAELAGRSISLWDAHSQPTSHGGGLHVYMIIAGYVAGIAMGGLALARPPMQRWQSFIALVGFVFVLAKIRHVLPFDIFKQALGSKLIGAAAYAGAIISALSLAKRERS